MRALGIGVLLSSMLSCALAHDDFPGKGCQNDGECFKTESCVKANPMGAGICTPKAGAAGSGAAGSSGGSAGSGAAGAGGAGAGGAGSGGAGAGGAGAGGAGAGGAGAGGAGAGGAGGSQGLTDFGRRAVRAEVL